MMGFLIGLLASTVFISTAQEK